MVCFFLIFLSFFLPFENAGAGVTLQNVPGFLLNVFIFAALVPF